MQEKSVFFIAILCCYLSCGNSSQSAASAGDNDDESNPLLDMASMFIQETLNNQNNGNGGAGGAAGLAGVASLIGSFMQTQGNGGAKGASGAMQILSTLGSLMANSGNNKSGGSGGFDPSIITNVLEMFTNNDDTDTETSSGRSHNNIHYNDKKPAADTGLNMEAILQIASVFMNNNNKNNNNNNAQRATQSTQHHQKKRSSGNDVIRETENDDGLMSLLPLVLQAVSSFAGPEGQHTQEKHKDHAWVLPPFLEHIHVLWDHFSNSELADALYEKSGVNKILRGFNGRDGKLDYDKLFESLNNQSFRRRWIKAATLYLADWASYLANPEVYLKYFQTTQLMFNGFLKSQGYPKNTLFDANKPSETISNLLDHVAKNHLNVKIDSRQYVKPAVGYAKDLLKLGQARGLLKFNATDLSEKLTDTLNLEVIEPVLKVHRAYRFIKQTPHCDRYVLCSLNSGYVATNTYSERQHQQESAGVLANVSSRIVRIGSMGAAIFISTETGTPFWTLFGVINSPYNCEVKYPVDCSGFHAGEAKVTTEYIHNEL